MATSPARSRCPTEWTRTASARISKDGVLTLSIKKTLEAQPKKIAVQSEAGAKKSDLPRDAPLSAGWADGGVRAPSLPD